MKSDLKNESRLLEYINYSDYSTPENYVTGDYIVRKSKTTSIERIRYIQNESYFRHNRIEFEFKWKSQ